MRSLVEKLGASPALARVGPFALFVILTFCQGKFGEASRYWFYFVKTMAGAWMIWLMRPHIAEMKWAFSWEAVAVGIAVFALWVGIDGYYPSLDQALDWVRRYLGWATATSVGVTGWNPHAEFGESSALAWMFIAVRAVGSTLVVPPLEEVFYRSFFYRYLMRADFQSVPMGRLIGTPFVVTGVLFGLAHSEWLAGILCGFAYQGLVCRKQRLGDAMTAHAITNSLLAAWVVGRGAWKFW